MKKIAISLVLVVAVSFIFYCASRETYVDDNVHSRVIYDFEDVVANPENYPDYSIEVFDSCSAYIDEIMSDENVNSDIKNNILPTENEANIVYARYKDKVAVTDKYSISPYYYIKFIVDNGKVNGIDSITAAAIDLKDDGKSRSFNGAMLYLNESNSGIYQCIWGNIYKSGKTTFRQDNTETLMRVEYYVDLNGNPRDSVSFDSQRGIYFQFNK